MILIIPFLIGSILGFIVNKVVKTEKSILFNIIFCTIGALVGSFIYTLISRGEAGYFGSIVFSVLGVIITFYIERFQNKKLGKLSLIHNYISPFILIFLLFINLIIYQFLWDGLTFFISIFELITSYYLISFIIIIILFYSFVEDKTLRKKAVFFSGIIPIILVNLANFLDYQIAFKEGEYMSKVNLSYARFFDQFTLEEAYGKFNLSDEIPFMVDSILVFEEKGLLGTLRYTVQVVPKNELTNSHILSLDEAIKLKKQRYFKAALSSIKQLGEFNKESYIYYYEKADLLFVLEHYEEALENYKYCLELFKTNEEERKREESLVSGYLKNKLETNRSHIIINENILRKKMNWCISKI